MGDRQAGELGGLSFVPGGFETDEYVFWGVAGRLPDEVRV